MAKKKKLKKWIDVYPQGTKEGDEEQKFFIALARHKQYTFRSTAALVKETGLTEKRVEEIIQKYFKKGMVFAHPTTDATWGYWERNPELVPADDDDIGDSDKKKRIDSGTIFSKLGHEIESHHDTRPEMNIPGEIQIIDWTTTDMTITFPSEIHCEINIPCPD